MSERLMCVHSRRVIRLTRTGEPVSEWELCRLIAGRPIHYKTQMKIFGQHDEQTLIQFENVREQAVDAALMADGHVGYVMPIGGVAAYRNQVSVVGVGFDIACGNAAIRTDLTLDALGGSPAEIRATLTGIADSIADTVSFGMGRKKLGQPVPLSNLAAELNSGNPQPAHANSPRRCSLFSGLEKGRSVPASRKMR